VQFPEANGICVSAGSLIDPLTAAMCSRKGSKKHSPGRGIVHTSFIR
jgi:hypothetical protein